jgi:hypothetical protein
MLRWGAGQNAVILIPVPLNSIHGAQPSEQHPYGFIAPWSCETLHCSIFWGPVVAQQVTADRRPLPVYGRLPDKLYEVSEIWETAVFTSRSVNWRQVTYAVAHSTETIAPHQVPLVAEPARYFAVWKCVRIISHYMLRTIWPSSSVTLPCLWNQSSQLRCLFLSFLNAEQTQTWRHISPSRPLISWHQQTEIEGWRLRDPSESKMCTSLWSKGQQQFGIQSLHNYAKGRKFDWMPFLDYHRIKNK